MRARRRLAKLLRSLLIQFLSLIALLAISAITVSIVYFALVNVDDATRSNIVDGVASNLVTTAVIALLGITTFVYFSIIDRRRLFEFFGISSASPALSVYLARLQVKERGTEGTEDIKVGYVGPTIVQAEYEAGLLILDLFQPKVLVVIPDVLRALLGALFITMSDIKIHLGVSPIQLSGQPSAIKEGNLADNTVAIGGGIYNSISLLFLRRRTSFYSFSKDEAGNRTVMVRRERGDDEVLSGRPQRELAIIERVRDVDRGTTTFVCAGLGSGATYGSVDYLVQNWRRLQHKYGQADFGLCLAFETQDPDSYPPGEPSIIHETSRSLSSHQADSEH